MNSIPSRHGSPKRRRFSPDQIQAYLRAFERSGLSVAAFTREHGLCYSAFWRWRQQSRRRSGPRRAQPQLQPVALGALLAPTWGAEIVLPHGVTVRLHAAAAPTWATQLLTGLRAAC